MQFAIVLSFLLAHVHAFAPQQTQQCRRYGANPTTVVTVTSLQAVMEFELVTEPEGGTELEMIQTTTTGTRMKEMESREDDGETHTFWMTAFSEADLIKSIRTQVLKDASKKANFPGFRKGQVPPYAQPQITLFAVQESIIKTVESVIASFGLQSLPGSDGQVEVLEDVKELARKYKAGDTIAFTATVNCKYDPDIDRDATAAESDDVVVDVEASADS